MTVGGAMTFGFSLFALGTTPGSAQDTPLVQLRDHMRWRGWNPVRGACKADAFTRAQSPRPAVLIMGVSYVGVALLSTVGLGSCAGLQGQCSEHRGEQEFWAGPG